jgi:hypothetical protein
MTHMRSLIVASAFGIVLAVSTRAGATPIGAFSYDIDPDPFIGPVFTVEDFAGSGGTFTNVLVRLFHGSNDVEDLSLGSAAPGTLLQSAQDLTDPLLAFDSATLAVSFSLGGPVTVDALTGLTKDATTFIGPVTTPIVFTQAPAPAPVPEPATLLLVTTGLASALASTRRRRKT